MADIPWPDDLTPYRVMFYLQPHVGGSESPITRTRKVYGLSAPRWIARLTFRGGYGGAPRAGDPAGYGPRLEALIADLEGGLNRTILHDFRRPKPIQQQGRLRVPTFNAVLAGAMTATITGFQPGGIAYSIGDYIGGDGRPHIITGGSIRAGAGTVIADASGAVTVTFRPPLAVDIAANTPVGAGEGRFQLTSEDAGQNETDVGGLTEYALDFIEDLP